MVASEGFRPLFAANRVACDASLGTRTNDTLLESVG